MDFEEARELMHKLNHGEGRARSISAHKTEVRTDPDGFPSSVERVDLGTHALGHVGSATPCCEAGGENEHTSECGVGRSGDSGDTDANDWLRRALKED